MNSDNIAAASFPESNTTTSNGQQHEKESNALKSDELEDTNRSTSKVKNSECDHQTAKKSRPNEEENEEENKKTNHHENEHEENHHHHHHHSHHSHTSRMPPLNTTPGHIFITNDIQNPRQLLAHLLPSFDMSKLPASFDDFDICRLVYQVMSTGSSGAGEAAPSGSGSLDLPPIDLGNLNSLELDSSLSALNYASAISSIFLTPRDKLNEFNTIDDCLDLIERSRNIIVLTGAGCSVSCGIPDFRSRDGIYARLHVDFPDLPDPQSMFDIMYFEHDPRPFFKFAKEIYPGQYQPSLSHRFIRKLELKGKLLRNYTQNIDTLEMAAQINNVIQCHGSFATASCTNCKYKVSCDYIKKDIFDQKIPYCDKCNTRKTEESVENKSESHENDEDHHDHHGAGILKPDIVFFGEGLPEVYHKSINDDKNKCDLLIVIGSSLKVKPVANIPLLLPKNVPQVLINRESLRHMNFDVELLGDCDGIVNEILNRLEERRLARLNTDASSAASADSAAVDQVDEVGWADICRDKTLLQRFEGKEAEDLVFAGENRSADENSEEASLDEPNTIGIHEDDKKESQNDEEKAAANEAEKEDESATTKKPNEEQEEHSTNKNEEEEEDKNKSNHTNETADESNRVVYTKDYLKEHSYLYLKPNIHIFHGAEVSLRFMRKKLKRLRKSYEKFVNGGDKEHAGNDKEICEEDQELDDYDSDDDDEFSDDYEETEEEEEEEDDDDEETDDEDDDDEGDENECSLKKLMEMHGEQEEESDEEFSLDRKKAKDSIKTTAKSAAISANKLNGNHREQTAENGETEKS